MWSPSSKTDVHMPEDQNETFERLLGAEGSCQQWRIHEPLANRATQCPYHLFKMKSKSKNHILKSDINPIPWVEEVAEAKSFKENPSFTKLQFLQINPPSHCPEINFHLVPSCFWLLFCISLTTHIFPHTHTSSSLSIHTRCDAMSCTVSRRASETQLQNLSNPFCIFKGRCQNVQQQSVHACSATMIKVCNNCNNWKV